MDSAVASDKTKKPNLQSASQELPDPLRKAMPHAEEAEKSVLSSMMQDPQEYLGRALEQHLLPQHFYKASHGKLFQTLIDIDEKGDPIEPVSLTQKLEDNGQLANLGGRTAIFDIFAFAPTHAHFDHHLDIVKDKALLREVIRTCTESITEAFEDPEDVNEFLDQVEQGVFDIKEDTETSKDHMAKDYLPEISEMLESFATGENHGVEGLDTGYEKLNKLSNGLKPGEMFIIAARPSMGKTSFMMNIVEEIAVAQKVPTLVFSCEMPNKAIVQRLLFSRAEIPMSRLRPGLTMSKKEILKFKQAVTDLNEAPLFLDDTPSLPISDLRAKARRKKRDDGIGLIAVDYLQLMRSTSKQAMGSREREIAEISAGLKAVAKELEVPVIVLAQLNRGPENRGGTPRMSDLRESGSIEQDADMIGLLYRTAYYKDDAEEKNADEGIAELVLAKNRNGATDMVPLTFQADIMKFVSREYTPDE